LKKDKKKLFIYRCKKDKNVAFKVIIFLFLPEIFNDIQKKQITHKAIRMNLLT